MKKKFAFLMSLLILDSNIGSTISFATITNGDQNQTTTIVSKEDALASFNEMQNEITQSMTTENGKYNYNSQTIKEIVDAYDFSTLKASTGIDFTNDSFFNTAISLIDNCNTMNSNVSYKSPDKYNVNATVRE